MRLCSPAGRALPLSLSAVARPRSLEGLRVGLLDNSKSPVDAMMAHIERWLRDNVPGVQIHAASKVSAAVPMTPQMLQNLRQNCDVVINALGD